MQENIFFSLFLCFLNFLFVLYKCSFSRGHTNHLCLDKCQSLNVWEQWQPNWELLESELVERGAAGANSLYYQADLSTHYPHNKHKIATKCSLNGALTVPNGKAPLNARVRIGGRVCMDRERAGASDAHRAIKPVNPSTSHSCCSPKLLTPSCLPFPCLWHSFTYHCTLLPLFLCFFHSCPLLSGTCSKKRVRFQFIDSGMLFTVTSCSLRVEYGVFLIPRPCLPMDVVFTQIYTHPSAEVKPLYKMPHVCCRLWILDQSF